MPMMIYEKSNGQISTFKVVLIASSVLLAAVILMLTLTDIGHCLPSIYNDAVSWLKPPYLYVVINCIIVTILASSKFHPTKDDHDFSETMGFELPQPPKTYPTADAADSTVKVEKSDPIENEHQALNGGGAFALDAMSNKENEYVRPKSTWKAPNSPSQPLSARFNTRRNVVKASPEGGRTVLGVSKAKRQDTLENAWKTITEGRPVPISRHLKKSETMETQPHHKYKTMNKSETFNDRSSTNSNSSSSSSGKLRKDSSLSQDELNRRVEAFINKFNQEMRLQRQHSLNQYNQMVKP